MKRQRADGSGASAAAATAATASGAAAAPAKAPVMSYTNKHRCLVFGSRGMTARYRHLLEDVRALVPHHKKESKVRAALPSRRARSPPLAPLPSRPPLPARRRSSTRPS